MAKPREFCSACGQGMFPGHGPATLPYTPEAKFASNRIRLEKNDRSCYCAAPWERL